LIKPELFIAVINVMKNIEEKYNVKKNQKYALIVDILSKIKNSLVMEDSKYIVNERNV